MPLLNNCFRQKLKVVFLYILLQSLLRQSLNTSLGYKVRGMGIVLVFLKSWQVNRRSSKVCTRKMAGNMGRKKGLLVLWSEIIPEVTLILH